MKYTVFFTNHRVLISALFTVGVDGVLGAARSAAERAIAAGALERRAARLRLIRHLQRRRARLKLLNSVRQL